MLFGFDPFRDIDRTVWQESTRPPVLPIDAYRRGDTFHVHVDLPGVDPASIELTVDRNVLTVRAERDWTPAEGDRLVAAERPRGTFTRQLLLGETLDAARIEARYEHGVLTVTVPVAEAAKPRKVEISVAEGASGGSISAPLDAGSSEVHAA